MDAAIVHTLAAGCLSGLKHGVLPVEGIMAKSGARNHAEARELPDESGNLAGSIFAGAAAQ